MIHFYLRFSCLNPYDLMRIKKIKMPNLYIVSSNIAQRLNRVVISRMCLLGMHFGYTYKHK